MYIQLIGCISYFAVSDPDWLERTAYGLNFSQNTVPRELWRPRKQKGAAAEDARPCHSSARPCTHSRRYARLDARPCVQPCVFDMAHGHLCDRTAMRRPDLRNAISFSVAFYIFFSIFFPLFQGELSDRDYQGFVRGFITTFICILSTLKIDSAINLSSFFLSFLLIC